ncbi:hypothetical protein GUJ93_ZPchr0001g32656 [Zizania palustris]|uniref:HMA domain-containing protein n=1 Tax=Zizania palustris TaxID=103762 RepID=A0A8J5VDS0_ZIZPA|nr:hypothetical protein GUJ93_ZPchr0001g32656 [Zizania palustris]
MKVVLKVPITCKKCKSCILQIVSHIKGIKSLTFDDEKNTLTVVGEVDVVVIVDKLRKAKYTVVVETVSDEKKEAEEKKKDEEEKKKKEDEEKKKKEEEEKKKKLCEEIKHCAELKQCCKSCRPFFVPVEPQPSPCTIL